jgi:hypothetical protein
MLALPANHSGCGILYAKPHPVVANPVPHGELPLLDRVAALVCTCAPDQLVGSALRIGDGGPTA